MIKTNKKLKRNFSNSVYEIWKIASLTKILKATLEYDNNINRLDTVYLVCTIEDLIQKQKYRLSNIKKDMFGL